jgi:hypothetical protein
MSMTEGEVQDAFAVRAVLVAQAELLKCHDAGVRPPGRLWVQMADASAALHGRFDDRLYAMDGGWTRWMVQR